MGLAQIRGGLQKKPLQCNFSGFFSERFLLLFFISWGSHVIWSIQAHAKEQVSPARSIGVANDVTRESQMVLCSGFFWRPPRRWSSGHEDHIWGSDDVAKCRHSPLQELVLGGKKPFYWKTPSYLNGSASSDEWFCPHREKVALFYTQVSLRIRWQIQLGNIQRCLTFGIAFDVIGDARFGSNTKRRTQIQGRPEKLEQTEIGLVWYRPRSLE